MNEDVDFIDVDNSDPPQLWAWSGDVGDESSEPLFRLPSAGILDRHIQLQVEFNQLQTLADERLAEIEQLRAELQSVADMVDDILFDPSWSPVDVDGNPIRGDDRYLLDHPVQKHHMPALREWFVKYSAAKAGGGA